MKLNRWTMGFLREQAGDGGDGGGGGDAWYSGLGLSEDTLAGEGVADALGGYESADAFVQSAIERQSKTWDSDLSEEVRSMDGFDGLMEKFGKAENPIEEMAKGYLNVEKLASRKAEGVKVPGEDASEAELAEFYNSIGRPDDPDGYEIDPKFTEGDDAPFEPEALKEVLGQFHEAGLPQSMLNKVLEIGAANMARSDEQFVALHEDMTRETMTNLKEKWGKDYGAKMGGAMQVAEKLGLFEVAKSTGLANHQPFVEAMALVNDLVSESKLPVLGNEGASDKSQQRQELMKHPAYHNAAHPEHGKIMAQLEALYK